MLTQKRQTKLISFLCFLCAQTLLFQWRLIEIFEFQAFHCGEWPVWNSLFGMAHCPISLPISLACTVRLLTLDHRWRSEVQAVQMAPICLQSWYNKVCTTNQALLQIDKWRLLHLPVKHIEICPSQLVARGPQFKVQVGNGTSSKIAQASPLVDE